MQRRDVVVVKIIWGRLFLVLWIVVGTLVAVQALDLPAAFAQSGSASLSGRITDQTNAVIPDVEVELRNADTAGSQVTKTNGDGFYAFPYVKPGNYIMSVRKQNFQTVSVTSIELHTQDSVARNFVLQVGSSAESITVNANNEHMETDSAAVGVLVSRTFVENTPLNGRSFQDLIALAPGAVSNQGTGTFSINGQRDNANYYSVDGVAANLNPVPGDVTGIGAAGMLPGQTALGTTHALLSVGTLQEFKIQTSGYTAEYGRQPGGQVELASRSGTNDIHGSLFEYFRNDVFDANDWFFNQQGLPKQKERQNDFGGTIGGPLKIPKLYNGKDKTFYFVSYEGLRLVEPQFSGIRNVPTLAFRQFAASGVQPFLNALPLPNVPGHLANGDACAASAGETFSCTGEWGAGFSQPSTLDSMSFRVDQNLKQRLQLFARYSDTPSAQAQRFVSEGFSTSINSHSWTVGSTARITSNSVDDFRFNYSWSQGQVSVNPIAFGGAVPYPRTLLVPTQYAPGDTTASASAFVIVPGLDQIFIPQYNRTVNQIRQFNIIDSFSWTRGKHTLKFGADYRRLSSLVNSSSQYGSQVEMLSLAGVEQGFADVAFFSSAQPARPIFHNLSIYAQDHLKFTPKLTLDYGLRWELNPPPGESNGVYPLALTTSNETNIELAPAGTPQYRTTYHNFAPRFGFAYNLIPSQNHLLVVRAGFGLFYNTGQALGAAGFSGYPFQPQTTRTNIALPASAADLAPPPLNAPLVPPYGNIVVNLPSLTLPYTEQWNLSVDLGLATQNILTVNYVGNGGRKLLFTAFVAPTNNPSFANGLALTNNAASSSYNALQLQDAGYVAPGMQLVASYTWAHAIDSASHDGSGGYLPVRGNSDNDVRQVFNAALNYLIPGTGSTRFVHVLTNGWSTDARFTVQTGYPLDLQAGTFFFLNSPFFTIERPDVVPGVNIYLHSQPGALGGWALNPATFTGLVGDGRTPPGTIPVDANGNPLRQGTLGRNFIHGPNFWNLNMAVQRNFAVYESLRLIFRVEAFNILNHANAGGIDTCLCDSTFGFSNNGTQSTIGVPTQIYGTGAARSLQLMLKLQF
jgi:hypothetical protein